MARVLRPCIVSRQPLLVLSLYQQRRSYPVAGLILSGNTLYGTASCGGTNGTWHGVQSFHPAATENDSFRPIRDFDVADQLRRVHFAIHHEPWFIGGLENQFSSTGRHRRGERRYQHHSGKQQFYRLSQ